MCYNVSNNFPDGYYVFDWKCKNGVHLRTLRQFTLRQIWNYTKKIYFSVSFSWCKKAAMTKCLWTYCFETHQRKIMLCGTSNSSMHHFTPFFSSFNSDAFFFFRLPLQESICRRTEALDVFCTSSLTRSIISQLILLVSLRLQMNHRKCIFITQRTLHLNTTAPTWPLILQTMTFPPWEQTPSCKHTSCQ